MEEKTKSSRLTRNKNNFNSFCFRVNILQRRRGDRRRGDRRRGKEAEKRSKEEGRGKEEEEEGVNGKEVLKRMKLRRKGRMGWSVCGLDARNIIKKI